MSASQRFLFDAFRDMQRAMTMFDQSLYDTTRRSGSLLNQNLFDGGQHLRYPSADMAETTNAYELSAELPGFDKKNIKIELPDNRTLVLSGSTHEEHESSSGVKEEVKEAGATDQLVKKDEGKQQLAKNSHEPHYWVKERMSGSFSRTFSFPEPVDSEAIKASFDNGVLKVTIPKASVNHTREITIE